MTGQLENKNITPLLAYIRTDVQYYYKKYITTHTDTHISRSRRAFSSPPPKINKESHSS